MQLIQNSIFHLSHLEWAAIILLSLLATFVLWLVISPPYFINQRSTTISASAHDVFSTIANVAAYPLWRCEISEVNTYNNEPRWHEIYKNGCEILAIEERKKELTLSASLYSNQAFVGFREIICIDIGNKTKVLITETICYGRKNFWQTSNIFYKNGAHLETYLQDLKAAIVEKFT